MSEEILLTPFPLGSMNLILVLRKLEVPSIRSSVCSHGPPRILRVDVATAILSESSDLSLESIRALLTKSIASLRLSR
jgi:hypothetical protein